MVRLSGEGGSVPDSVPSAPPRLPVGGCGRVSRARRRQQRAEAALPLQVILLQALANLKMEAAGIEPAGDSDGIIKPACSCGNCEECRAASALHFACANSLDLSSIDTDLLTVVLAWAGISEPIRKAIVGLAMVDRFP